MRNRKVLFAALLLAALPRYALAQQCVSTQVSPNTPAGSSIIINNVSFPDDAILQAGANDWNASSCGNGGAAFPEIIFGSQPSGNARFIDLYYDPTTIGSGACGNFSASSITLYAQASLGNDPSVVVSCTPVLQENFEHEVGHVLGLADSACSSYIMGSISIDAYGNYNSRYIHADECSAVDGEYKTPSEQLTDLDWCNLSCPTGCKGIPPTCPQPPPSYDGGCPDCGDGYSPIILNLANGEYQLSGTADPVTFDINADGIEDRVSWTAGGADMAFLVLDRNHNGSIDDGSELFGDRTLLIDGRRASNGFEALRQLDSNGDGIVDERDVRWPELALWIDRNHDGRSQPEEFLTLPAAGITALGYSYHWTGRRDRSGNIFRWEAHYVAKGQVRTYYDVYLVVKR